MTDAQRVTKYSGWSFDEEWMTEQSRKYPLWCALSGPDCVSLSGHVGREIGQLCLDAINVRHETGLTPRQLADEVKRLTDAHLAAADEVDLRRGERDSLQRRVEELERALRTQQSAEDFHANCPECSIDPTRDWACCEECSNRFGPAIDMRCAALASDSKEPSRG